MKRESIATLTRRIDRHVARRQPRVLARRERDVPLAMDRIARALETA
ncbi:hypothetical protein [Sphingomicrobium nitratireducens]|nr:hypothetical protein [Sphingomicrobium nitratireducens]